MKPTFFRAIHYKKELTLFPSLLKSTHVLVLKDVPVLKNISAFYKSLALKCGNFVPRDEDPVSGEALNSDWIDIQYRPELKNLSIRFDNQRQAFHTDSAYQSIHYDISFFYCKTRSEIGGATTFIDGQKLVLLLKKYFRDLYSQLLITDILFDKGKNQHRTAKIITFDSSGPLLNWNYYRISKINSPIAKELCERFHHTLETYLLDSKYVKKVILSPREAVFFHDQRVLHGRQAFLGDRWLQKGGITLASDRGKSSS